MGGWTRRASKGVPACLPLEGIVPVEVRRTKRVLFDGEAPEEDFDNRFSCVEPSEHDELMREKSMKKRGRRLTMQSWTLWGFLGQACHLAWSVACPKVA
eukprot:170131-Amphidinium_carterae.4